MEKTEADPKLVTLSFLDSESKLILNRIYDKLECLDQKMAFVTEFLLAKVAKEAADEAAPPPAKLPRPASRDHHYHTDVRVQPASGSRGSSPAGKSGSGGSESSAEVGGWGAEKAECAVTTPVPLPAHSYEEPEEDPGPPPVPGNLDVTSGALRQFPEEALRRAAEKASKSFSATQPKVFAWQMFRETHSDQESSQVKIPLRTSNGEQAEHFLARQTSKVRGIALATLEYFGWADAAPEFRLAKAKLICSHIKNNAKVRNWTLREGMRNGSGSGSGAGSGAGAGSNGCRPRTAATPFGAYSAEDLHRSAALHLLAASARRSDLWPQTS